MATANEKKMEKVLTALGELGITINSGTPGIAPLTGSETLDELTELLRKATEQASSQPEQPKTVAKESKSVTFTMKNGATRTFSQADHGEAWQKLADEFAETNKNMIVS